MVMQGSSRSTKRGACAQEVLRSADGSQISRRGRSAGTHRRAYAVENDINGRLPEERREIRNPRSRSLLESLKQWLEEALVKLSKKSDTAMAVRHALGRWEALMCDCDDGHLEIDNSIAERALRAVALGRNHARPEIMRKFTQAMLRITNTEAGCAPIQPLMNCA